MPFTHGQGNANRPVIVIEDSRPDARLFSQALLHMRLGPSLPRPQQAASRQPFLATVSQLYRPELVLMDETLPRSTANAVLSWIRREALSHPILVISVPASEASRTIHLAEEAGANLLVLKPHDYNGCIDLVYRLAGCSVQN